MKKLPARLILSLAVAFTTLASPLVYGDAPVQLAEAQQIKSEAFKALRDGKWDKADTLLNQAAAVSKDPTDQRMATWSRQFEVQQEGFATERRKQYDKAVSDIHLLEKNGYNDYAIDIAKDAYLLADDKTVFRSEKWVDDLITKTVDTAQGAEKSEQWIKALRLYSDLSAIEPLNPQWKDQLKLATRRLRLLALYAPDELKSRQEAEFKSGEAVEKLLAAAHPTTTQSALDARIAKRRLAATKPTTTPSDEVTADANLNWHDSLRGITMDMLWNALVDVRVNYWRDVSYRDLMVGGLKGLDVVATTKGLEKTFPGLGDPEKRQKFATAVQDSLKAAQDSTVTDDQFVLYNLLFKKLTSVNKETVGLPDEVLVSEFADGAFAALDPFSSMIWPNDVEEFNKMTQGEFSGVGIQIEKDDDGSLKVVSPIEDSPAYKAGIKAGDFITKINGKSCKGISINQAVRTITGTSGTYVELTVKSGTSSKDYNIKRETIKVGSIKGWSHRPGGGWDYLVDPENKIAYVRMTSFTKNTAEELDKAIDDLKQLGAKAMILDLRHNPGGLLPAAIDVCDKFMSSGVIVSTHADRETPNQPTVATAKKDDDECQLPLVVLVNQYSASASEIVSGALKDQHRAIIVGERTFGKGSVQMIFPLAGRTANLRLTTYHYYLPSGRCLHREENSTVWGVDPDVTVPMTPEQMRAAIDARQDLDVLRDAETTPPTPAEGEHEKLKDQAKAVENAVDAAKTDESVKKAKDPLSVDPQLSAALLMLRLQLAGAQL